MAVTRYMAVTPERTPVSVGEWPLHTLPVIQIQVVTFCFSKDQLNGIFSILVA
jgi:hypothetical protein